MINTVIGYIKYYSKPYNSCIFLINLLETFPWWFMLFVHFIIILCCNENQYQSKTNNFIEKVTGLIKF